MFYSYWTSASFAVLSVQRASYVISVRQTRVLSTASFRFHLAMDTLAFNYTLTTAGRIRDLHPLEFAHAGQTKEVKPNGFTSFVMLFRLLHGDVLLLGCTLGAACFR